MAKVLTEYMASYNAGETQQPTNATIAHKEQALPFDKTKVVGMQVGVKFGWVSVFYVMKILHSSDDCPLMDDIFTLRPRSVALMSWLLRSSYPICQLKQHLDLDMLPEQLQIPCLERFTVWYSAGKIYPVTTAQPVSQKQPIEFSHLSLERQESRV